MLWSPESEVGTTFEVRSRKGTASTSPCRANLIVPVCSAMKSSSGSVGDDMTWTGESRPSATTSAT